MNSFASFAAFIPLPGNFVPMAIDSSPEAPQATERPSASPRIKTSHRKSCGDREVTSKRTYANHVFVGDSSDPPRGRPFQISQHRRMEASGAVRLWSAFRF